METDARRGGRLAGKVALVTGGARGLGEAVARLFVAEGASVVLTDVLDDLGAGVADELGPAAHYLRLDVAEEADWNAAVAHTVEHLGRIDVLVNNAAVLRVGSLVDTTPDAFMECVRVNQLGVFLGMRAVAPVMEAHGGGSIVNVSSVDGLKGLAGVLAYSGTKWAVRGMTKCAALELGRVGIRVNSVHPGGMDTPMSRPDDLPGFDLSVRDRIVGSWPLARIADPAEAAWVIVFLASDEASYCTGGEFAVDGGQTAGPSYF